MESLKRYSLPGVCLFLEASSNQIDQKTYQEVLHYIQIGRYEQAQDSLVRLIGVDPNNGELLYLMACCCYGLEKSEDAFLYCSEALKNGFSAEDCNSLLGSIYIDLNRYVEAEQCMLEALRLNPQNASLLARYGYLMLKTGHEKKAKKLMEEALRIEPDDEEVLKYNFYYYLAKNKKTEQMEVLHQYFIYSNNEVRKLIHLGLANLFSKNYKSARENFREAFLLDPTNEAILELLRETDYNSNFLFLPQRIILKIGGPAVAWIAVMALLFILNTLKFDIAVVTVGLLWVTLCLYTWATPLIYKIFKK